MVMSWFYQLVSLKANDQENIKRDEIIESWDWSE
jgi:hypothetical protein